jgi:glycosyltransferase involved in cell wall biosynthesis
MPKLSIITVNLNNREGLERTIQSVVSQTFSDFEYIIIDGGSTDGSVEVIREYADRIDYWVSEPDKGIYNAMNKGIKLAKGEYLLFLNSGDWLADENVIGDFCDKNFKDDIVSGNMMLWDNGVSILREAIQKEKLEFEHFYENHIPHPATFIRKKLFEIYGLYNENFKIVSDWEFFLNCLVINKCRYNNFERLISYFDMNGVSSQQEYVILQEKEKENVLQSYLPLIYKSYKAMKEELRAWQSKESDYREYMNLKNGKFSILIKLLLFIKRILK